MAWTDDIHLVFARREKLRRLHNEHALTNPGDFAYWKRRYFRPVQRLISAELSVLRQTLPPDMALAASSLYETIGAPVPSIGLALAMLLVRPPESAEDPRFTRAGSAMERLRRAFSESELEAVSLPEPDAESAPLADPYEDFTTYTEYDPNSKITVATNTLTLTYYDANQDRWVYADKGAGYFGSSFEHDITFEFSNAEKYSQSCPYAVADASGGWAAWSTALYLKTYWPTLTLYGSTSDSTTTATSTPYYVTIIRDGATADAELYSDPSRTSLIDTLSVSVGGSDTYQYIFPWSSDGGASKGIGATVSNLDLHESSSALIGSTSITFGVSGAIAATGALVGSTSITFGVSGAIAATGALVGSTSITFGVSGAIAGTGALVGSTSITFGVSGTFATGELIGIVTAGQVQSSGVQAGLIAVPGPVAGQVNLIGAAAGAVVGT